MTLTAQTGPESVTEQQAAHDLPAEAVWVEGLTATEAESLLDRLEASGHMGLEMRCTDGGLFAVRWLRPAES